MALVGLDNSGLEPIIVLEFTRVRFERRAFELDDLLGVIRPAERAANHQGTPRAKSKNKCIENAAADEQAKHQDHLLRAVIVPGKVYQVRQNTTKNAAPEKQK